MHALNLDSVYYSKTLRHALVLMVEMARLEPSVQKMGETLFLNGPTYPFFGLTHLRFPLFFKNRCHRSSLFQGFMILSRRWDFG